MKRIFFTSIYTLFLLSTANSQSLDEKTIKETILGFAKAADTNNAEALEVYLDENYRVVMNRLFNSGKVAVMPKNIYLEKVANKEFGGDTRTVNIESLVLNGSTASAKVTFTGSKMTFVSILTLIKDGQQQWKLVSDVPQVQ